MNFFFDLKKKKKLIKKKLIIFYVMWFGVSLVLGVGDSLVLGTIVA